jgi:peptidoglycan L-alanyl-D-glutamate endopeptidase CwlK
LLEERYLQAREKFCELFPELPPPCITCTYRSPAEQLALYAQSRAPLAQVNALRHAAGMRPITPERNRQCVTYAQPGDSAHNYAPALAFDVAFVNAERRYEWGAGLFEKFAALMCEEPRVEWGGNWRHFKDLPHFQLRNWRSYVAAGETAGVYNREVT